MKALIAFALGVLLYSSSSYAQTPPQNLSTDPRVYTSRKSFWFEANLAGTISKNKKWQYQADIQYRRMSDASYISGGQHGNIFKDPYQFVFRPFVHYWLIPGSVRLSLSPIGYWATWTPPEEGSVYTVNGTNQGQTFFPEWRTCPQLTTVNNFGRVQLQSRYRYEFRWLGSRQKAAGNFSDMFNGHDYYNYPIGQGNGSAHQGRFRWQTRLMVPLNHKKIDKNTVYLNVWDEVFISLGKGVNFQKMLNQNRFVALMGYRLNTDFPVKIEAGITFQTVFYYNIDAVPTQPTVTYKKQNAENNLAYTVYLVFDEFHTMFKNKREKQQEKIGN